MRRDGHVFAGGIRCPYHSLDLHARRARSGPPRSWRRATVSPRRSCRCTRSAVDSWGGFIFLNLAPARRGRRWRPSSAGAPGRVRRYPLADLRAARRIVYEVAANWKVILENYNECYHCGPVHPELCRLVPAFKQRGGAELDWERGIPHREGAWTFTAIGHHQPRSRSRGSTTTSGCGTRVS